jgi:hypothetical protein
MGKWDRLPAGSRRNAVSQTRQIPWLYSRLSDPFVGVMQVRQGSLHDNMLVVGIILMIDGPSQMRSSDGA